MKQAININLQNIKHIGSVLKFDNAYLKDLLPIYKKSAHKDLFCETIGNNKDVLILMVEEDGMMLKYGSNALKDDKEVVQKAVKQNPEAIKFASDKLKNDRDLAKQAIQVKGNTI